ncbi:glycosyltransferase family 4 protein [bacterium]|jgi:glycosyltransferase involved in cell wall biosynthesis|nr:glycosyltransferase family 4 protein [bacterium]
MSVHKYKNKSHRKIAMIHYSYPPVIGGVEFVIEGHANLLSEIGYKVKIITASGGEATGGENIEIDKIEEIWGGNPIVKNSFTKKGKIRKDVFNWAKKLVKKKLRSSLKDVSVCIIHNIMTMHFNLVLTAALYDLINEMKTVKFIVWTHDLSMINPDYRLKFEDEYPRALLKKFNKHARYVAISEERQRQMASLFGIKKSNIKIVPNGIDVKGLLNIDDEIWKFAVTQGFFEKDFVAFFATRILKRKNIEKGMDIIYELKKRGLDVLYVITGPPDPHNKEAVKYYEYLLSYRKSRGLEKHVRFMTNVKSSAGTRLRIDTRRLRNLYRLCDILLLTSSQEGFGLPLLEAGLFRMPIFCSDIKPLQEVFGESAVYFGLNESPKKIADKIMGVCQKSILHRNFKKVMLNYSWPAIYHKYILKIIT